MPIMAFPRSRHGFVAARPMAGQRDAGARRVRERKTIYIRDVLADPEYTSESAAGRRFSNELGVPLLRDGKPIGVIT